MSNPSRKHKFDKANLAEEIADGMLFLYYLGSLLDIEVEKELDMKIEKLREMFGVSGDEVE